MFFFVKKTSMDELKEEIQQLKRRVAFLEMFHKPCYEMVLNTLDIESILACREDMWVQVVRHSLNRGILQVLGGSNIYICHKHIWIKSDLSLKDMFKFVEGSFIKAYTHYLEQHPELDAEHYETYNSIIYSLNLKRDFQKMKNLIIASI
jgi:hypothetical protein